MTTVHSVPKIWEAALLMIKSELNRTMWNLHNEKYKNPFDNSGNKFSCSAFSVEAYSWDKEYKQKYNFKWKDVEISWHKHFGRGNESNIKLTPDMAEVMLVECLDAIRKYENNNIENIVKNEKL